MIERLDDDCERAETANNTVQVAPASALEAASDEIEGLPEDGELKESERSLKDSIIEASKKTDYPRAHDQNNRPQHPVPSVLGVPHAISNGMQDETLKNLMMSWYYAGYYTGLYEAQASK